MREGRIVGEYFNSIWTEVFVDDNVQAMNVIVRLNQIISLVLGRIAHFPTEVEMVRGGCRAAGVWRV